MTFNPNARLDPSQVTRRSGGLSAASGTGIAVGGLGGIGAIVLLIISLLTGTNLTGLGGLVSGGTSSVNDGSTDQSLTDCTTGESANNDLDCRIVGAATSLRAYWSAELPKLGQQYTDIAGIVLFTGATDTGCGQGTTDMGPFYCPNDQTIYLDTAFIDELRSQFGASGGPLAELYVIGHEWGHHIQNITGIMNGLDLSKTGAGSDSVRLELQADCFAGAWIGAGSTTEDANGVTFLEPVTQDQLDDALDAAQKVGDDYIEQHVEGTAIDQDTWTHGSSAERQKWFSSGLSGGPNACNTFSASNLG